MKIRDSDKDGFISNTDYKIVIDRYRKMGTSEEQLKKLEKYYSDTWKAAGVVDDSTSLTYHQFRANFNKAGVDPSNPFKIYEAQFEGIDTNGNGVISFNEWLNYYKALGIDTKYARKSFDAMDNDHDGTVSKAEFLAYAKEFAFSTQDKLNSSIMYGPLSD